MRWKRTLLVFLLTNAAALPATVVAQAPDPDTGLSLEDTCQPQPDCRTLVNPPAAGHTMGLSETTRSGGMMPRSMRRHSAKPAGEDAAPPEQPAPTRPR